MDRSQYARDAYDRMNKRDFDLDDPTFATDLKAHIPGFGIDTLEGRENVVSTVRDLVEKSDLHYEVLETAELGPFGLALVRSDGTIDGEPRTWQFLQVSRWDGDQVTEMWSLRA